MKNPDIKSMHGSKKNYAALLGVYIAALGIGCLISNRTKFINKLTDRIKEFLDNAE